jgi:hypothetical protein
MIQSTLYKLLNIILIILKLFKICTLCYLFHYYIYIYIYIYIYSMWYQIKRDWTKYLNYFNLIIIAKVAKWDY